MQIAKNTFDISAVNSSGVGLVGSVILYAGTGDENLIDEWCERHALGIRKALEIPGEPCTFQFEPVNRGKNTLEIQYEVKEPIQRVAVARRLAKKFSEAIAVA